MQPPELAAASKTIESAFLKGAPFKLGLGGVFYRMLKGTVVSRILAFLMPVRNNPLDTAMHLSSRIVIAVCLILLAAGKAAAQQEPADSVNSAQQTPPASPENAPAGQVPLETIPPAPPIPLTTTPADKPAETAPVKRMEGSRMGKTRRRRKRAAAAPSSGPRKIVVREGGADEPTAQIVPGITPADASRQRQNAEQLLGSTDVQLKPLAGRALDAQQQEMLAQIRNYVEGARSALKEGDVRRASTLAEKAHLLAEDLVKR